MLKLSPQVVALLTSLPTTLIAATLAYWFGKRQTAEGEKRRAKQLATTLLIELRNAESIIREMYLEEKPATYDWEIPLPLFGVVLPECRVFSAETFNYAHSFYGQMLEINSRISHAQEVEGGPDDEDHHFVRAKAGFVLEGMRRLAAGLKREGGQMPPLEDVLTVRAGGLPPLPPVLFPEVLVEVDVGGPARHE